MIALGQDVIPIAYTLDNTKFIFADYKNYYGCGPTALFHHGTPYRQYVQFLSESLEKILYDHANALKKGLL
jgi:hypothetical protein